MIHQHRYSTRTRTAHTSHKQYGYVSAVLHANGPRIRHGMMGDGTCIGLTNTHGPFSLISWRIRVAYTSPLPVYSTTSPHHLSSDRLTSPPPTTNTGLRYDNINNPILIPIPTPPTRWVLLSSQCFFSAPYMHRTAPYAY